MGIQRGAPLGHRLGVRAGLCGGPLCLPSVRVKLAGQGGQSRSGGVGALLCGLLTSLRRGGGGGVRPLRVLQSAVRVGVVG